MEPLALDNNCGSCQHVLGKHYVTYDGKNDGCNQYFAGNPQDDIEGHTCKCDGFIQIYRPSASVIKAAPLTSPYPKTDNFINTGLGKR